MGNQVWFAPVEILKFGTARVHALLANTLSVTSDPGHGQNSGKLIYAL